MSDTPPDSIWIVTDETPQISIPDGKKGAINNTRSWGEEVRESTPSKPADIEETAIPINFVTERLRRCGADNVVLILDACRSLGTRGGEGIGKQTAEQASQQGVISIFSCSPQEYSYEIEALQQGAFTTALFRRIRY